MHPHLRHLLALAAICALALPSTARAHAVAGAKSPVPDSVFATAPATVRVVFSEPVTGTADALIAVDAAGTRISGPAAISGKVLTAPITAALPGRYAYAYTVESLDGHVISAAFAFAIRSRTPSAQPVALRLSGHRVRLSGARVGLRTLRLWPAATEGTVRWISPLLPAPLIWTIRNGSARGLLPFAGSYVLESRVRSGTFEELMDMRAITIDP